MNNIKQLPISPNEASDLAWALEMAIERAEDIAEQLIYHTFSKQAGFNQIDRANRLRRILQHLDTIFPEVDEDDE
jgi:hypothetical protein